jgi:hypothetical protein
VTVSTASTGRKLEPEIKSINLNVVCLTRSHTLLSLGINLDSTLNINYHVDNSCEASDYDRAVRQYLSHMTMHFAALFASRLEYLHAILNGVAKANIDEMQLVQNMLACVYTKVQTPLIRFVVDLLQALQQIHNKSNEWSKAFDLL